MKKSMTIRELKKEQKSINILIKKSVGLKEDIKRVIAEEIIEREVLSKINWKVTSYFFEGYGKQPFCLKAISNIDILEEVFGGECTSIIFENDVYLNHYAKDDYSLNFPSGIIQGMKFIKKYNLQTSGVEQLDNIIRGIRRQLKWFESLKEIIE